MEQIIVKRLWQSVTGEWSGDVDLDDGKLQDLYKYCQRNDTFEALRVQGVPVEEIKSKLISVKDIVQGDLKFISSGMYT